MNRIHKHTRGYPFWLDLWANSGIDPASFLSASHLQKIEERFFEMFPQEEHQNWLRQAAFFRRFDQEMLGILLGDESQEAFSWLIHQSSLIESDGRCWKLHDIPRKIILTNIQARSHEMLSVPVTKILNFFENKLKASFRNPISS